MPSSRYFVVVAVLFVSGVVVECVTHCGGEGRPPRARGKPGVTFPSSVHLILHIAVAANSEQTAWLCPWLCPWGTDGEWALLGGRIPSLSPGDTGALSCAFCEQHLLNSLP